MRYLFIAIIGIAFFSSCTEQPTCDDADVKIVLFDIIKEKYNEEIQTNYFKQNLNKGDIYTYARDKNLDYETLLSEKAKEIEQLAIQYADSVISETVLKLDGIRILSKNEDLMKCKCAAELLINEGAMDIEYLAQNTEDNQIYVEVYY